MRYPRLFLALLIVPLVACDDNNAPVNGDVMASGTSFSPAALTLPPTDSIVTWGFADGPHNVTWEDGAPGSGDVAPGGEYTREFVGANNTTYRYRCTIHSTDFNTGMVGSVTVP